MISVLVDNHKKNILNYEKHKNERIKILKKWKNKNEGWLDAVEKKMVSYGLIICDNRRNFLKQLNHMLEKIDKNFPLLKINLKGDLDELLLIKPAIEVEEIFASILKKNREKDLLTGRTNYGVNKTDIRVIEKKNPQRGKNFFYRATKNNSIYIDFFIHKIFRKSSL